MLLTGHCFCNNIKLSFFSEKSFGQLTPRECGCSFCSRHRPRYISDSEGELILTIMDEAKVNRVQFGTKTADFLICSSCGVLCAVTTEIDGNEYAVANINCLENNSYFPAPGPKRNYEAESVEERTKRRLQTWTPLAVHK